VIGSNNLSNNTRAFVKVTGCVYIQAKDIIARNCVSLWSSLFIGSNTRWQWFPGTQFYRS